MWIARDMNGDLCVFEHKPKRNRKVEVFQVKTGNYTFLKGSNWMEFGDLTWENSPKEIIITKNV